MAWNIGFGSRKPDFPSDAAPPPPAPSVVERGEQARLLQKRIAESGLSARRFATDVLRRDERTIRRWLANDSPIPATVLDFLADPEIAPWPGPTAAELVCARCEVWLRALDYGELSELRHVINPQHVGGWLAHFPISDELREYTLGILGQAHQCIRRRKLDGARAAILAIRRRWRCGPTGAPLGGCDALGPS